MVVKASEAQITAQAAEKLKGVIDKPEWAQWVKTGMHKERAPTDENWYYARAASVLRTVNRMGPIGVSKLRTKYGGIKNRGHKTERFYRGSGKILRTILQQLEQKGLVKQEAKGKHKGRVITPKGQNILFSDFKKTKA
ncbi:MAG: 40S ribosomal protein S19 [Nanoarchaeota archaeon]